MMTRKLISETATLLLILLFAYAAVSKLIDFQAFQLQMLRQPLPEWMAILVSWTLLPVELVTAALLAYQRTRKTGLYLSLGLMVVFTGYIALAVAEVFDRIPCVCGGVLKSLDWESHLVFNVAFTLIAFLGIITTSKYTKLSKKKEKPKRSGRIKEATGSGDTAYQSGNQ